MLVKDKGVHISVLGPFNPGELFEKYIRTASEFLRPDSGSAEELEYSQVVWELEGADNQILVQYAEVLDEYVVLAESLGAYEGLYDDDGIGAIRNEFNNRFTGRLTGFQYIDEADFQGCGGLL